MRGQISQLFVGFIPDMIFLAIWIVMAVSIVDAFMITEPDTLALESDVLLGRVLSADGISYVDPLTGRVYSHIVDAEKLDAGGDEILEHLFYGKDGNTYAALFTLAGEEYYLNKDQYRRWRPQAGRATLGEDRATLVEREVLVQLKRGEDLLPLVMQLEVVRQP